MYKIVRMISDGYNKTFTNFDKMIEKIKEIIPAEEIDAKKYNI